MAKLYTPEEIAADLQVTVRMVKQRAYSQQWPCQRLGERTIRFTQDQYDEILRMTLSGPAQGDGNLYRSNAEAKLRVKQLLKDWRE